MTATSVASSSQMFSAFGQPTRSPSPAFNPFASHSEGEGNSFGIDGAGDSTWTKHRKRKARLTDSDNEGKRKPSNPFKDKDASLSDGGNKKSKKGEDCKRKGPDTKKHQANGSGSSRKTVPQKSRGGNEFPSPFASNENAGSRPTSVPGADAFASQASTAPNLNDPHARKVFQQLQKDGISPPQWPSEPGNPTNKAEMAKFREKYESYRSKVRASLTKAGLIDDPDKRKALQDAIDFKGICEDMCPEYEKITRINEMDVVLHEKDPKTMYANTQRMVKKLARSAAGQEAPLPMDVRSVRALRRTLDYLIDDLLRHDENLPGLHGFLWDRTRAIRRDFTFFSSLTPEEMKTQVYVLENIARFHVTALHLLSQEGKAAEDFVEQQELEQLGKSLLSLRDLYDDCNEQGISCENEPEFRAYYIIFHAFDPNILETLQRQWKPNLWRDSDEVRTAVSLVEALQSTQDFHGPLKDAPSLAASSAYNSYFRIVEDPKVSYTMACFAECHFPHLRRSILTAVKKALQRPRETSKDVTAAVLNKFLRFDTVEEAIEFAELHDFEFGEDDEDSSDPSRQYLILDNRKPLPHHRLQHQFSQTLVEKKRGSRSLPELIHQTVREDPNSLKPQINGSNEESLFVPHTEAQQKPQPLSSRGLGTTTPSPFSAFGQPSGGLGPQSTFTNFQGTTITNGTGSNLGAAAHQPSPVPNPFAPASTPSLNKPAFNPFAPSQKLPNDSPFQSISQTRSDTSLFARGQPASDSSSFKNPFGPPQPTVNAPPPNNPFNAEPSSGLAGPKVATPEPSPLSFPQQTATPATLPQGKDSSQAPDLDSTSKAGATETKTLDINIVPPTPQVAPAPFKPSGPGRTPLSSVSPGSTQPAKFTPAQSNNTPPSFSFTPTTTQEKPPSSAPIRNSEHSSALPEPTPPLPSSPKEPSAPASLKASLGNAFAPLKSSPLSTSPLSASPIQPRAPSRDLMGDFARWFVKGDNGLLEDFQAFMVDNILQDVFASFTSEQDKKRRKEEEERAIAEAREFRVYNLSLKYFYRWKELAREKRLGELRRSGRDQIRKYWAAQRAAQLEAQREAARQAAREQSQIAELNRPEEFRELLKHKKASRRQAEDELLASGVLSGVANEEEAVADIVRRGYSPSINGSVTSNQSKLSRSSRGGGGKTQALREQFSGGRPAGFRRSLPPMSSREQSSPSSSTRTSRVSERWRLKAMGIVQMPDGTALPESLANEIRLGTKKYPAELRSMPPPDRIPYRRASLAGISRPEGQRATSGPLPSIETPTAENAMTNKRKRPAEDDGAMIKEGSAKTNVHRRVMSDAEKLMDELRALREEMEEGASWFRAQNERLQSELSRGSTPRNESV